MIYFKTDNFYAIQIALVNKEETIFNLFYEIYLTLIQKLYRIIQNRKLLNNKPMNKTSRKY